LQLPIFVMEFVVLGARPIAAMIDAKCLLPGMAAQAPTRGVLRQAHQTWPALQQSQDMPQWYLACRSGDDFFVRPRDMAELDDLAEAYRAIWRGVVSLWRGASALDGERARAHAGAIRAYKDHHREHAPGLPLLTRSFGAQWTEAYFSRHVFA
jgi:Ferredoxin-dependent bilin reductase